MYFGIYRGLIRPRAPYNLLLVPLASLTILSLGPVYEAFAKLPIPLLQGERVSARIFGVVLIFGLVLATEQFQRWIEGVPLKIFILGGSVAALLITGVELWQDFLIWRVSNSLQDFWIYFLPEKWDPLNNMSDTIYIALVFGGLGITIIALAVLSWLSWREHRCTLKVSSGMQ
jgi:hypothetical protein